MTVKDGLRRLIIKKTIFLLCIALALGLLCFFTSNHQGLPKNNNAHLKYTVVSIVLSIVILLFIAWKIRFFHNLFAKEIKGTVVNIKREIIRTRKAMMSMDDVVLFVQIDGTDKKIKIRLPGNKVGGNVYFVGDRVHRLKGTRFPINLTREEKQHICPICARDSCYDDECPDCRIKY